MPKKLKPADTVWAPRVNNLYVATGYRQWEFSRLLKCSTYTWRDIIVKGKTPSVNMALRIKAAEKRFAEDLQALAEGAITIDGQRRTDWRLPEDRPEDLKGLGEVGVADREFDGDW